MAGSEEVRDTPMADDGDVQMQTEPHAEARSAAVATTTTEETQPRTQSQPRSRSRSRSKSLAAQSTTQSESQPRPETHQNSNGTAQQEPRPTSPPLPEPHIPITPGPRASRLQAVYAQSLRQTLKKIGWENFAGCFPTISTGAEGVLKQVQGQMVQKMGEKCEREFENIMAARQVVPKLNELEHLIGDAAERRRADRNANPIPPHLLPPTTILAAHTTPHLLTHRSQLNARLQTTQSQNALLHDELLRQRAEIESLLQGLEKIVGDVKDANDVLGQVVGGLAREAREGEEVLRRAEREMEDVAGRRGGQDGEEMDEDLDDDEEEAGEEERTGSGSRVMTSTTTTTTPTAS